MPSAARSNTDPAGQVGDAVTDAVAGAVAAHGDNPSAFLALNTGNRYFTVPGLPGVVAYRPAGRYLVQFGGPFASRVDYAELLRAFLRLAGQQRRRVVAVQLQRADAEVYATHGFMVNQLGASYALRLDGFSLRGGRFTRLRNKISRARRAGVTVTEVDQADAVAAAADQARLDGLDREWLRGKGWHARPLRFLVGEHTGPMQRHRRLFTAQDGARLLGYVSYVPVTGCRPGWLHDLSRRGGQAPPGVMEAINAAAIARFQAERAGWLHFGFTPFTGLDPAHTLPPASATVDRLARLLAAYGEFLYPARSQLAYKQKWGPHVVLPEYLAFQGRPRPGAVWHLLRTINVI
jgi:lysylphosphatidylglycerol synthetase-like protein (DUF2156 family)